MCGRWRRPVAPTSGHVARLAVEVLQRRVDDAHVHGTYRAQIRTRSGAQLPRRALVQPVQILRQPTRTGPRRRSGLLWIAHTIRRLALSSAGGLPLPCFPDARGRGGAVVDGEEGWAGVEPAHRAGLPGRRGHLRCAPARGVPHRPWGREPGRAVPVDAGNGNGGVVGDPGNRRRGQDPGPAARHPHGAVRLPDPARPAREGPVDRRRHRPAQGRETSPPLCGQARRVRPGDPGGSHPGSGGAGFVGAAGPGAGRVAGRHRRPRRRSVRTHRGRSRPSR